MASNSSIDEDKQIQWLENGIIENYINYYDYNEFKNIRYIGSGGFSTVYRATWKNSDTVVALKYVKNNNFFIKEIVNEIKLLQKVNLHHNIIQFFGITKRKNNDDTNYLLILEYADSGTLGEFLKDNFNRLDWNMKLQFAIQIADAVSCLHENDIIHCDLHSDNILVHQNMLKLADFGLSHRLAEVSTQKDIFGVLPYIDPQHYQTINNKPNKKSDIYSVGVLLWEISSGRKPFESYYPKQKLLLEILNGKRETPIPNTPIDYINIYTKCWNINPQNRPDMQQVLSLLQLINIDLNEIIINEIILQYENSIQKKVDKKDIIQLIKIYLIIKNTNENEIFKYLLDNNNKQQNIRVLAIFYHYGIGTEKNENKAFEFYEKAAEKGDINATYNLGYCYQEGIGTKKDEIRAFEIYKEAVKGGQTDAINNLGECYYYGIGTEKDKIRAFELYKEATEKGNIDAIYSLGYCYVNGIGTEKNEIRAFELYKEATEKGNIDAINSLGYCYDNGIGTEKNEIRAFELYKEAAEKGNIDAIYNLGYCYGSGIGTEKDQKKAFELYKKATEKGIINAIYDLGYCYQEGIGIEKDEIRAFELYKEAAEKGVINAINNLGYCYNNGIGTEKNEIKAFELCKEAAEKGNINAMYNLGCCYNYGIGTEKNENKAFGLFKEAAEKGVTDAINNLGYCYNNGIGSKKDKIRAFELYKKAAKKGNTNAIYNLGYCYKNEIGTEKNEIRAFEFYKEAVEKGNINAIYNLANCYENGIGTKKDKVKAFELYFAVDIYFFDNHITFI